jgi:hypothetical protein
MGNHKGLEYTLGAVGVYMKESLWKVSNVEKVFGGRTKWTQLVTDMKEAT